MWTLFFIVLLLFYLGDASAQDLIISEVMSANVSTLADEDEDYPDWIEIYNAGPSPVNLNGFALSDDDASPFKWVFPEVDVAGGEYVLVFASGKERSAPHLHANFKIASNGEPLILTSPAGETIDRIETGYIPTDISRGRLSSDDPQLYFFPEPTPGASNSSDAYLAIAQPPQFSPPGGIYSEPVSLTLETSSAQAIVRYTLDGSTPDDSSVAYVSPILIDSTTVIRARTFEPGLLFSNTVTQSYVLYQNHNLSVVSLSTDPANLWDEETGIYVLGSDASPEFPYFGANFWEEWERPLHIDFFEPDGCPGFSADLGVQIWGGWSRAFDQKSLALFARDKYGLEEVEYQIFPDKPIFNYKSFILRNSGNDWLQTMMRDALLTDLVSDCDLDYMAYRPSIVFLNGEYWGIYNVREKINEDFLASHRGVDPDNLDLLENDAYVLEGDADHYNAMMEFIESHDLTVAENYEYVKTQMDVHNYACYQASEIYIANFDWPDNNIKYWRPRRPGGRWKWILFDLDGGFSAAPFSYSHNTLAYATDPEGAGVHNPPWSTFLFRSLLENVSFRNDFINYLADLMNVNFRSDRVVARIDTMVSVIEPEMPAHQARWGRTMEQWYDEIDVLYDFAVHRTDCVRVHLQQEFDLEGTVSVLLDVDPDDGGRIKINSKIISSLPWEGIYFLEVPICVTALPNYRYRFSGWNGTVSADSSEITIEPNTDVSITAIFESTSINAPRVIITEINYNSAVDFDPEDWLELYNYSGDKVDISGWTFKDSNDDNSFTFPSNVEILPASFLILCRDTATFLECFPAVENCLGNFDFGLNNNGESIRLFDAGGNIVDSLTYDDEPPWPVQADGMGATLQLINPAFANESPENWRASLQIHGSPGQGNGWIDTISVNPTPEQPTEFLLLPGYPNPFNVSTRLTYHLPNSGHVSLKIFNLMGQEVAKLVNGWQPTGVYDATFSSTGLASGIYFAHLEAYGLQQVQKLLLLK